MPMFFCSHVPHWHPRPRCLRGKRVYQEQETLVRIHRNNNFVMQTFLSLSQKVFRALPLAAKVGSTAVAVHGCLGPEVAGIAAIHGVWRRTEPPRQVGQPNNETLYHIPFCFFDQELLQSPPPAGQAGEHRRRRPRRPGTGGGGHRRHQRRLAPDGATPSGGTT